MSTKLPYLNLLEVESVNKDEVSRAIVIDKDEYVKALDIEQITTYQGLSNKPKINGVELNGDISLDEFDVASKDELQNYATKVEFTSEITELENTKQEVFQVNQPLSFVRDNEDLTLNVDLSSKQDLLVSGDNIKTINNIPIIGSGNIDIKNDTNIPTLKFNFDNNLFEGDFYGVFNAINNLKTAFSVYLPMGTTGRVEATQCTAIGNKIQAVASIVYENNVNYLNYTINPDGTSTDNNSATELCKYSELNSVEARVNVLEAQTVKSSTIRKMVQITQEEYDNLDVKDDDTLYIII